MLIGQNKFAGHHLLSESNAVQEGEWRRKKWEKTLTEERFDRFTWITLSQSCKKDRPCVLSDCLSCQSISMWSSGKSEQRIEGSAQTTRNAYSHAYSCLNLSLCLCTASSTSFFSPILLICRSSDGPDSLCILSLYYFDRNSGSISCCHQQPTTTIPHFHTLYLIWSLCVSKQHLCLVLLLVFGTSDSLCLFSTWIASVESISLLQRAIHEANSEETHTG